MFITKKLKCKSSKKRFDGISWIDILTHDKWYDVTYETWLDDEYKNQESYKLNNRWRSYSIINNLGESQKISPAEFKILFDIDRDKIREDIIDEILNNLIY